jgi:ATP-dependent DNA helicase
MRRRKCDVELNLPPKKEIVVYAPMTQMQRHLYTMAAQRTLGLLCDSQVCICVGLKLTEIVFKSM